MLGRTRRGPAWRFPANQSGNGAREAASNLPRTPGASSRIRVTSYSPTRGRATSRSTTAVPTAGKEPLPRECSHRTVTASSTWRETCGSGPRARGRTIRRCTRVAPGQTLKATSRSSRVGRTCVLPNTACGIGQLLVHRRKQARAAVTSVFDASRGVPRTHRRATSTERSVTRCRSSNRQSRQPLRPTSARRPRRTTVLDQDYRPTRCRPLCSRR